MVIFLLLIQVFTLAGQVSAVMSFYTTIAAITVGVISALVALFSGGTRVHPAGRYGIPAAIIGFTMIAVCYIISYHAQIDLTDMNGVAKAVAFANLMGVMLCFMSVVPLAMVGFAPASAPNKGRDL